MIYSYTQISHYLTCPRRYRHRYLDGWREKDTRAAMMFGRAFERALITAWELPPGLSPRIQLSHSRERQPGKAPITAWSLHWQECPIALRLEGSSGRLSK